MTHFGVLVLVDQIDKAIGSAREAVEPEVTRLLAPYDENDEAFREGSKWDWWVIGGRWTGSLSDYDPTKDERNFERCGFCVGGITTQAIADRYPAYKDHVGKTCIQCKGTGKVLSFRFVDYDGDVQAVAAIDAAKIADSFAAVVTPDGAWHGGAFGWWGAVREEKADSAEAWQAEVTRLLGEHPTATAVVVDCHV